MIELSISRSDLLAMLSSAASAAATKSPLQCHMMALLDASDGLLRVSSSDGYVGYEATAAANVNKSGKLAIEARRAADIVKALPGDEVAIKQSGDAVELCAGRSRFKVPPFPADYLPAHPSRVESSSIATTDASALLRALRAGSYARDDDDSSVRSGVLLDFRGAELRVVSACTSRMTYASFACESQELELVFSTRGYGELVRLCEAHKDEQIAVSSYGPTVFFQVGHASLWIRTRDEKFPPYRKLLSSIKTEHTAQVPRAAMIEALKRISLATERDKFGATAKLFFSPGSLGISTTSVGSEAEDTLDCDAGFDCLLSLNPQHLTQALAFVTGDSAQLEVSANERMPCVVRGDGVTAFVMQRSR